MMMLTTNKQIELHFLNIRNGLLSVQIFFVTLTELKFLFRFSLDNKTLSSFIFKYENAMSENNIVRY